MLLLVNAVAMMGLPIAVGIGLRRATGTRWTLAARGALTFLAARALYYPLLAGWQWSMRADLVPGAGATASAIVIGLLVAACEEGGRALALGSMRTERGRVAALMVGVGHGGVEALGIGALAMIGAIGILAARDMTVPDFLALGVPESSAELRVEETAQALAMPWYDALGGAFERAVMIPFHLACSVLVMAALRRRRLWPLTLAFVAHATLEGAMGVLRDAAQREWILELELTAIAVPFSVLVLAWAQEREPGEASV